MPHNFTTPNGQPRPLRSQLLTQNQSPDDSPSLRQHSKWLPFVRLIHNLILTMAPELRPQFLELLEQADSL